MDFDKPKVYGDTSITDGLVRVVVVRQGIIRHVVKERLVNKLP